MPNKAQKGQDTKLSLIGTVVVYILAFMLEMVKKSWFAK